MIRTKEQKGITLIALVVTIIILIILASVSITMVLGENGLIEKAKEAKRKTEQAKINDEIMMNEAVEYIENGGGSQIITGPVAGGSYDNPYIPDGFTHTEGDGTWNSGYTIKEKGTNNEFVWVPCVTDQSKVKPRDTVVTFGKVTTEAYNKDGLGLLPEDDTVADEDSTVEEIEKSVGNYGGFYIAKYEAGLPGTTRSTDIEEPIKSDFTQKPVSKAGVGVWNFISRPNALTVSKNMVNTTDGVKSTLISGAAWDTTLQWMVTASDNKDKEPNKGYDINSENKGNYSGSIGESTGTGNYAVNNIYDMAGNMYEWTSENTSNVAILRGGYCYGSGSKNPAAERIWMGMADADDYDGFRPVLYKKV